MKVKAYKCPKCKDLVYSRARHDMRFCSCGNLGVDGGFDYTRIIEKDGNFPDMQTLEIDATRPELYEDWNERVDEFGLIKAESIKELKTNNT